MTKNQAEKNLKLALYLRVFAKRVFLPLYAVYFTQVIGLSLRDIGLLGAFFSLIGLVSEVPTGYFADRYGRVNSIRVSGVLTIGASLFYVFAQNKAFVFAGTFMEAVGYAFFAGAVEALVHDSLVVLGKEGQYTKISARIQSRSLIVNAAIIGLVPMTYAINPRFPFLIGALAYSALLLTSFYLSDRERAASSQKVRHYLKISNLKKYRVFLVFVFVFVFGAFSALYTGPSDIQTLAFKEYGFNPAYLGWLFAGASLIGALLGEVVHYLKKIEIFYYLLIDVAIVVLGFFAYSTANIVLAGIAFLCAMSFWRYRKIIYQDYLLEKYPTNYKATLLSFLNNSEQLHAIWIPIAAATLARKLGLPEAFRVLSIIALAIGVFFIAISYKFLAKRTKIKQ